MIVRSRPLDRGEVDHERIWGWTLLVSLTGGAFLLVRAGLPPLDCPFHWLTGIPCPTCGATRAFAALLAGNVRTSLRLHPLVAPAVVLIAIYVPYALVVSHANLQRLRVVLDERDWRAIRIACAGTAAMLWIFLIADRR